LKNSVNEQAQLNIQYWSILCIQI